VIIDADAHVLENERTWEYMDPADRKYRPQLVDLPESLPQPQAWVIPSSVGGSQSFVWPIPRRHEVNEPEVRELRDPDARLKLMDKAGIDVQVLHTTMFLRQVTDRPQVDVPICRAWNRWMAGIASEGKGRLRWTLVPPLTSIPDAIEELRFGKQNGAVGVLLRPIEGERVLPDPYFYPLYEQAQRLNLPIVVHSANGCAWYYDLYDSPYESANSFGQFEMPAVTFCHQLTVSQLPKLFPTLRWAIVEAGAQWLPWIVFEAQRRLTRGQQWPDEGFAAFRTYVTCAIEDDLPEILRYSGEDTLIIGSNYGKADSAGDMDAINVFRKTAGLQQGVIEKIVSDNARALYGI
jgi:predicted TIM-barrel fold metal-dependent hydrolase